MNESVKEKGNENDGECECREGYMNVEKRICTGRM